MDVNFSQTNLQTQNKDSSRVLNDAYKDEVGAKIAIESNNEAATTTQEAKVTEAVADINISNEEVESAVTEINQFVQVQNRELNFSFDDSSKRSVIKVTDSESGDVIRQIPSEDVLKLSERIKELQSDLGAAVGVLFNKEV